MLLPLGSQRQQPVLRPPQLVAGDVCLILRAVQLALHLAQALLALRQLAFQRGDALFQPFYLIGAGQYAGVFAEAAARHRAGGIHKLTVQRHYAKGIAVALCHRYGVVDIVCHRRAAELA